MDEGSCGRQVGGDAEEREPRVDEVTVADELVLPESFGEPAGRSGGHDWQRRHREAPGDERERALHAGGVIEAPRGEGTHQGTDARAADGVDRYVRFFQGAHDTEMGTAATATPAEHEPDSGAGQLSCHPLNVGVAPLPHMEVATGREAVEQAGGSARYPLAGLVRADR